MIDLYKLTLKVYKLVTICRIPKLLDCLEFVDVTNEELLNVLITFFKYLTAGFGKFVTENMVSIELLLL